MAENQHDHEHGKMDITEQTKTFDWFVRMIAWNVVAIVLLLIFLALVNG